MSDPFANDPFSTGPEPTDPWAGEPQASRQENSVSAPVVVHTDGVFSMTFKQHPGYDAPWIVVRADTAGDAKARLAEMLNVDLPKAVAVTANRFSATGSDNGDQAQPPQQRPQQSQPAQEQLPPGIQPRNCAHGAMAYKTGHGKFGPWQAFFCPTPKGTPDQCKAVFL